MYSPLRRLRIPALLLVAVMLAGALLLSAGCARQPEPSPTPTARPTSTTLPPPTDPPSTATSLPTDPSPSPTPIQPPPTAASKATPTAVPPLTWQQLKNATIPLPMEIGGPRNGELPLEDGLFTWTPVPGSASVNRYMLYRGVAFGDVNVDGLEDAVVVIVNVSAGSGNFYYLTALLNEGGQPQALLPVFIGDRVIVEQVRVVDSEIDLLFWTYRPEEPFGSTPTLQVSRRYRLQDGELTLVSETQLNADEVVKETEVREAIPILLPEEGGRISTSGQLRPFGLDEYHLGLVAGQRMSIAVSSAHEDVFLSVFGLEVGDVLVPIEDEVASWQGTIAQTQELAINIFAISHQAEYVLHIEVSAPPATPTPAPSPTATPISDAAGVIYLTFDDGPTPPYTPQMLDLLAQHDARVTFFVLGRNGELHKEMLQAAGQAGHMLANHTWNHPSLAGLSQEEFNQEVLDTAALLGEDAAPCLRPPYGAMDAFTRAYAAELGYEVVMWNIDTLDWSRPGVEAIVSAVLENVYPGAIVLFHDGGGDRTQTVTAVETLLEELTAQGYDVEPLCQ